MPTNTEDSEAPVDVEVDDTIEQMRELSVSYTPVEEIVPNEYNPNRQNENEFRLLIKSMREDGFTQPIVCLPRGAGTPEPEVLPEGQDPDDHDCFVIIDGEHRWRAAQKLGMETVPHVTVDMDEAQARVSTLRHNRASGSEDVDKAVDVMRDLQELGAVDMAQDALQLDDTEMNRLLDDIPASEEFAADEFSTSWEPSDSSGNADEVKDSDTGTTETESGKSSASEGAVEKMREREKKLQEAKNEEERKMAKEDTSTYKLELIFSGEEEEIVESVLGDRPAATVLEMCSERYEGDLDEETVEETVAAAQE